MIIERNKLDKKVIEKGKKYTYEEIKEVFDNARAKTILKPFGKDVKEQGEEMVMSSLMAVPIMHSLEENMFEGEEN